MSGRTGLRGRRTRVYDCNYNMGESYYKPVLDKMDRKLSGRPEVPEEKFSKPQRLIDEADFASTRAEQALDDSIFDSRGGRTARGRPLSSALDEDGFDDEITSSLRRLRASKKSSTFAEDVDLESTISSIETRNRLGMAEKLLDSVGIGQSDISNARRALIENEERTERRIARRMKDDEATNMTRWTAVRDDESAAAQRAKASRARLTDLEDEMNEMSARQSAREQRAANLRALVADNEAETYSSTRISSSSRTDKKQVSF